MATKLQVPASSSIVNVSIIDSTSRINNLPYYIAMTPLYPGYEHGFVPCYVFLIHHPLANTRLLYDLDLRKNNTHLNPHLVKKMVPLQLGFSIEKDTADILHENQLGLRAIDTIILSHHHFDHAGDTTKFPPTTNLLVGPGTKAKYRPGYPADPDNQGSTSDTAIRGFCDICGFKVFDCFGDGSLYILHTPGHTANHLSALARTTPATAEENSTFIFMAGDLVHSGMCFRPDSHIDVLITIPNRALNTPPPSLSIHHHHHHHHLLLLLLLLLSPPYSSETEPDDPRTQPFSLIARSVEEDSAVSQANATTLAARFDADSDVLAIYVRDDRLLDSGGVLEFFPKATPTNEWKGKGWKIRGHWRFRDKMVRAFEAAGGANDR
ncbi:uncharacterized protein Z519_02507 [Cladophialophora bantiana CBS 173.52]|uniref:Metallo-beta-lactamase domain-containing protein n=1 Tax=Cladophialophora bantiana (strain ATCC 10958 / CBS 173.52 / CDC B-1940 / NIH 8579) TaxID=1442370 RepID=A0A0D2I1S4_CLAB1|nr:uncharacterized protein Z519_02507 [Cladophialophora bantiana CBS 173.52]KIW97115.1 hypothetical protein Z519_02507 [Cladophialophora bantiana CBS 173.52]